MTKSSATEMHVATNGVLFQIVRLTAFDDDGSVIGERVTRTTFEPGQDVTSQPTMVQRIAAAVWTPAVIQAYLAAKDKGIG